MNGLPLTNRLQSPLPPGDGSIRAKAQETFAWTGEILQSKAYEAYLAPRLKDMAKRLGETVLTRETLTPEAREQLRHQYVFLANEIIPMIERDHRIAKATIDGGEKSSPPKTI